MHFHISIILIILVFVSLALLNTKTHELVPILTARFMMRAAEDGRPAIHDDEEDQRLTTDDGPQETDDDARNR